MIVALRMPLNVATIILGCIFSMLFSGFRARGPINIPAPPTVTLKEFFHANVKTNIHPLPVSWYLISLLWIYLCSCWHIMSILSHIAEAVSYSSWSILFKFLTLNITIFIVLLHFRNFCFRLSFVADFSNPRVRAPYSAGRAPFLPARRVIRFIQVV